MPSAARDVPVHLLEGDAEERREQEEARRPRARDRTRHCDRCRAHRRLRKRSASSSMRAARDSFSRHSGESGVPSRRPSRQRACRSSSASRMPTTSSGPATMPAFVSRMSFAAAPSGRNEREDRPLGREILEHLPREDAAPAPARIGNQQEQRVGFPLHRERRAARHVVDELHPVAELEALEELTVRGAEVADEPHGDILELRVGERLEERLRVALAEERPCVGRAAGDRSARTSRPAKSSKSQPFAIVTTRPFGSSARVSSVIASAAVTIASAWRATSCATPARAFSFTKAAGTFVRAVRVQHDRVAQVGDPGRARRLLHRRPDQVHRAGRRGREHDVDALAPGDRDRLGNRRRVPRHVLVGQEQPAADRRGTPQREVDPAPAVQLVRDPTPTRTDVASPVHPGLRRKRQLCVGVDPLRVVGCEHVRLDAERRQMARELQRPLHAAAA